MAVWWWTQYRRLLDNMPDGVYFIDTGQKIRYWNKKAESITGISADDILGRQVALTGVLASFRDISRCVQQEIDFAASLAEQCGTAIENATMYEQVKKDYDDIMKFIDGAVIDKK